MYYVTRATEKCMCVNVTCRKVFCFWAIYNCYSLPPKGGFMKNHSKDQGYSLRTEALFKSLYQAIPIIQNKMYQKQFHQVQLVRVTQDTFCVEGLL